MLSIVLQKCNTVNTKNANMFGVIPFQRPKGNIKFRKYDLENKVKNIGNAVEILLHKFVPKLMLLGTSLLELQQKNEILIVRF